jgi:hypothetical protein
MAYRSAKDKARAQEYARKLYVEDKLSLEEIHEQTGKTVKTLRAWRNLGEWDAMQEKNEKTELDRLKDLWSSLLDRAEAQVKEGKLPHIEIGLMHKLEKMIALQEEKQRLPETVAMIALRQFGSKIARVPGEPSSIYNDILTEFGKSIAEQGFSRSPK